LTRNRGWIIGWNGTILRTDNGGESWQSQASGITSNLNGIHFADDQNGWVTGDNGEILYTVNGGNNWVLQVSGTTSNLFKIRFIDGLRMGSWFEWNYSGYQ